MDIYEQLYNCGIIPVIKLEDANNAVSLVNALISGGIFAVEITFRTDAAEESIRNISNNFKDVLVGAGTVLDEETAKHAVDSGAKFIVTPGFNTKVVEYCLKNKIPVIPGTSCATDIELGLSYGLNVLKFFPAEISGGLPALKALSAPYSMVKFMPTGGINVNNVSEYLAFDRVLACGGSWIATEELINDKNYKKITEFSKEAVKAVHNFRFAHIGIDGVGDARKCADVFETLFGFETNETDVSFFNTPYIEVMKSDIDFQHIGIRTNSVQRAISYFERVGVPLDYNTARQSNGKINFIYLKDKIGKFKIHLVQ